MNISSSFLKWLGAWTELSRWLYETCGLPVSTLYGGLPFKFRIHTGELIPYDPNMIAEELAEKVNSFLCDWCGESPQSAAFVVRSGSDACFCSFHPHYDSALCLCVLSTVDKDCTPKSDTKTPTNTRKHVEGSIREDKKNRSLIGDIYDQYKLFGLHIGRMEYHGVSGDMLIYVVTLVMVAAILISYVIPFILGFCFYFSSIFATIYKRIAQLKSNHSDDTLEGPRKALSYLWDLYGRIWHGYELHGLENIPEGPCLIIFYHGAIAIDHLIFAARYFVLTRRMCVSVIDRFFVKLPGLKSLLETFSATSGTKEECLNALKNGRMVAVSPGGAREAYFSDETYKLVWGNRKGFAQLAIDAKVPIIPMYTENIREAYMMPKERRLIRWLYETSRLPLILPHGGFPVKLRAHVGEPIPYDPNMTAEELAEKTKTALQNLIQRHQQIPGSMWKALLARFDKLQKDD